MGDVKEYYYMRLKENFFDEESLKIIEGIPGDGVYYELILLKLYLRSLRTNGKLMYRDRIPYNIQMLSAVTNQPESMVRSAMELFESMGLIERLDNGALYMMDIQNYIGKSSDEADRKREYRAQIEEEKALQIEQNKDKCPTNVRQMSGQMSDKCLDKCPTNVRQISDKSPLEIRDKRLDNKYIYIRANKDSNKSKEQSQEALINYQEIIDAYNSTCLDMPKVQRITDKRKKKIKQRLDFFSKEQILKGFELAQQSDFLCGRGNTDWQASFDWLFENDNNLLKVIEGNYKNKNNAGQITINQQAREEYVDDVFGEWG